MFCRNFRQPAGRESTEASITVGWTGISEQDRVGAAEVVPPIAASVVVVRISVGNATPFMAMCVAPFLFICLSDVF